MKSNIITLLIVLLSCTLQSQNWNKLIKFEEPSPSIDNRFGRNLDVFDDFMVVGSELNSFDSIDSDSIGFTGAAYVYRKTNGNWILHQKLVASDREGGEMFGRIVSIHQNTIAVSSYSNTDENSANPLNNAGAIYIFEKQSNDTWLEVQKITSPQRSSGDALGQWGLKLCNDTLFALSGNGANPQEGPAVLCFTKNGSSWNYHSKLTSPSSSPQNFGQSIDYKNSFLVIGDSREDDVANNSGSAYLFKIQPNGTWQQVQKFSGSKINGNSNFGTSVAISDNLIAIGANNRIYNTNASWTYQSSGGVHIYSKANNTNWVEDTVLYPDAPLQFTSFGFGISVDINDNFLVVGAEERNSDKGSVYIYQINNLNNFTLQTIVYDPNGTPNDYMGNSVAIYNEDVFAGSWSNTTSAGTTGAFYYIGSCANTVYNTIDTIACELYWAPWGAGIGGSGTYTDTISSSNGCDSVLTVNVTITNIDIDYHNTIPRCGGDGAIYIDSTYGGYSPYTYAWPNGSTLDYIENVDEGQYWVTVSDSKGCSRELPTGTYRGTNNMFYVDNIAFIGKNMTINKLHENLVSNLPDSISSHPSNPYNVVSPGKNIRFKLGVTNQMNNNMPIVFGKCLISSPDTNMVIIDNEATINNLSFGASKWTDDEFEIYLNENTPTNYLTNIDIELINDSGSYISYCAPILINPIDSDTTISVNDDQVPDSNGDSDGIIETNETIELFPYAHNVSDFTISELSGTLVANYLDSAINIWNNRTGSSTIVNNEYWWNFTNQPNPIAPNNYAIYPEFDYVFEYNFDSTYKFFTDMIFTGFISENYYKEPILYRWSNRYTFNEGFPDAPSCEDIIIDFQVTPLSNDSTMDGQITVFVTGGQEPYSYYWSNQSNAQSIDNLSNGNYYITVTDAQGCKSYDFASVDITSSIDYKSISTNKIQFYPNPFTNKINIISTQSNKNMSILILNQLGQSIASNDVIFLNDNHIVVDLSEYLSGMYIIGLLMDKDEPNWFKIVKE